MNTQHNDGGPAFPNQPIYSEQHGWTHPNAIGDSFSGLSLRDYFAAHELLKDMLEEEVTLQYMEEIVERKAPEGLWKYGNCTEMAKFEADFWSTLKYIRADAMIKARSKTP